MFFFKFFVCCFSVFLSVIRMYSSDADTKDRNVYVCMYVCIIHVCMYVCIIYVCMYVCMYNICMYVCMYV